MHLSPKTAAFFDLDKTLLAKSSGELYIRVLREQGRLGKWDLLKILASTALYSLNLVRPERLMDRAAAWYKGESEEVLAILEDVIEFTTSQFADEEHQLAINAFPQLEQHKRVHESFSRRLKEYRRVLQVGYNETIAKKLLSDMRIWLTDHILRDDCAYLSLFAQNRGRNWVTRALGRFINH